MNAEDILVAIAVKCRGDWESINALLNERSFMMDGEERAKCDEELEKYYEIAKNSDYKYTTFFSSDYPECFKKEYMPPFVIFYHGDLSLAYSIGKNIAVVGSREMSDYGKYMTQIIVEDIAKDYTVVSGMAIGIDTVAHETAIKNGGRTIAVLGGGINYCYPLRNRYLYEKIKENHLVISEYPGDLVPETHCFPRRNRLIAMLSGSVLVTEAHERSGTLTTVMFALQYNRLILGVPYLATDHSECNRLIAEGAYLVQNGNDVLEVLQRDCHM